MVGLPLEAGSGGGHGYQPLSRRLRHAENFGGIERGGGCDKLRLARIAWQKRPQLVGRRRGCSWPVFRYVVRDGLQCGHRQLLVKLREVLE